MPSPLAHMAMGYVINKMHRQKSSSGVNTRAVGKRLGLAMLPLVMSLLPDLDSVLGLLTGNFGRFHNNATHSLIFGLIVAFFIGMIASRPSRSEFPNWFAIALACYEMHVIMDFFTIGRGVMLFWPFSSQRFSSPVKLFYGLHWSDGWWSLRHIWTLFTELGFIVVMVTAVHLMAKRAVKGSSVQESV
jgi:inner membrane protein